MDTFKARQGFGDAPHKDANLHLAKKCGTGFQKAAQNPEQSNQADVKLVTENKMDTFKARQGSADAPQGCKLALGQEVRRWLPKSSSVSAEFVY